MAKESDGCRNFYYTDPTGFWECKNTVIPTNRAYLALPSSMTANAKQISFVIEDFDIDVTGVVNTIDHSELTTDYWYTVDGRKLDRKPMEKGVYIHNGRKEVVK